MEQLDFVCKGSKDKIINDFIYPGPAFELANHSYDFKLSPKSSFWRFGIRLSKSEEVMFYQDNSNTQSPEIRHINTQFPDIHLGVGNWGPLNSYDWGVPNQIHLAQYHLPGYPHFLNLSETYIEQNIVEFKIEYSESKDSLYIFYSTLNCPVFETVLFVKGYKYFKIFAWADKMDFEIECMLKIESIYNTNELNSFTNGHITFRLGDMLNKDIVNRSSVILLPASSNGNVSKNINDRILEMGLPHPSPSIAGSYVLYPIKYLNSTLNVGFAYSVDGVSSNYEIIETLCRNLLNLSPEFGRIINIPLFGTGAGNLKPIDIAKIYVQIFNSTENSLHVIVSIIDTEVFNEIKNELNKNRPDKINPDIRSRLHSDFFDFNEVDVLNYDLIADNLFTILTDKDTNPPLNIGILAPWGRGKTSLMKRVQKKFDDCRESLRVDNKFEIKKSPSLWTLKRWLKNSDIGVKHNIPCATVWFNPWNYQSSDMIWAGLADAVIEQVVQQIPGKVDKEIFWMQLQLARIDKDEIRKDLQIRFVLHVSQFVMWAICVIVLICCLYFKAINIALFALVPSVVLGAIASIASSIKSMSKTISESFSKYTKSPKYGEKLGTFHEVQTDLKRVLDLCIDDEKPLVIFVDDLDRCSPSKVVEVIEAINVFINGKFNNKCYFILGMDAEMVAAALDVAYEKMKGKIGSKEIEQGSIGWYFLDKFIQLPFFIPVMSEIKKEKYLQSLLSENSDGLTVNERVDVEKVEKIYQQVMSISDNVKSANAISNSELTKDEKKELDKMILKNQVQSPEQNEEIKKQIALYAKFISSDPRSLKRFTNLLRFYCSYQFLRMKKGESFVEAKILAKWLVLMLKFPQLIRWIQWDSEDKSGINTSGDKANAIDELVRLFRIVNDGDSDLVYEKWVAYLVPENILQNNNNLNIGSLNEMPWLKSKNLFKILMNESSEEAKIKNALECNIL